MGAALPALRLRQQPQYAVPIDRGNPLSRGLVHSWGLNVIAPLAAYDAAGSAHGVFAAGYVGPSGNSWQIGPSGYYLNWDDTGTGSTGGSVALAVGTSGGSGSPGSNTFSFCARMRVPSSGATQQTVYGSLLDGIEIRINTAGKIELLKQQRASIGASTASVPVGVDFDLGVSYNGSVVNFYINGAPSGSAASAQTFVLGQQFYLGLAALTAGTERLVNGSRIYRADVWNRAAAPAEFAAWSANPWQVYQAPNAPQLIAAIGSLASAPVSVTASVAWTEANDTHVVVGRIADRASIAWAESDDVVAITATVATGSATAALAWVEADDAYALTAVETDFGTIAWSEASDVMAATGSVTDRASLAWVESDDAVLITASQSTPTNVSGSIAWTEQDDSFSAFMFAATGGAPGYGKQRRKYVVRKGGQLLVFSDPDEAKAALHADDEPDPVKHYPAKKQSRADPPKVAPALTPDPQPEQRINLAELQALAKRQHAEAEYQRLLMQQRYETLLKLEERLREDEEDDWLLIAAE